jgi:hypothetical protein
MCGGGGDSLLEGFTYRGTIVRLGDRGHRFDPFGAVYYPCANKFIPTERMHDDREFEVFKAKLKWSIDHSLDPEPSWYIDEIMADKADILARIRALNTAANLPGIGMVQSQCA